MLTDDERFRIIEPYHFRLEGGFGLEAAAPGWRGGQSPRMCATGSEVLCSAQPLALSDPCGEVDWENPVLAEGALDGAPAACWRLKT